MDDFKGVASNLFDGAVQGATVRAGFGLLGLVGDFSADGLLAQSVKIRAAQGLEISPAGVFIEQNPGAVLADDVQDLDNFLEVADVVGGQGEADVAKMAIAVLEVLMALFAGARLGRSAEARIEQAVFGECFGCAGRGSKVVDGAVGNFDDRLFDNILVGSCEGVSGVE